MWVRKRIDIRWSDLAVGLTRSALPSDHKQAATALESLWSQSGDALACLSVRSGFDLLFQAADWPRDSEIIMSSVTIPDMPRIVHEHGLKTVPIDLETSSMSPDLDQLRAAITPRTKAIVIAHLFGGKVDLEPIARIAREAGLLLIEDCAQAFVGLHDTGSDLADVSMFSFGPIKTNTSLGGGLFRVRDEELLSNMRALHDAWPLQSRGSFARRLLKYAFVQVLSLRWIAGTVAGGLRLIGKDHDGIATGMARGFAGANFFDRIRKRPSTPLTQVLARRMRRFKPESIQSRIDRAELLLDLFGSNVPTLGSQAISPTYWVYPIVVDEPEKVARQLWRYGFDATWHSSLTIVEPDPESHHPAAAEAKRILDRTIYLPFSRRMPMQSLRRMAEIVLEVNPRTRLAGSREAHAAHAQRPSRAVAKRHLPQRAT